MFVSSFSFSQQGFGEIIINTTNNQITTRTWDLANGNSPSNVDGIKNFANFCNHGYVTIYFNNNMYEPNFSSFGNIFPEFNETIGNGQAYYLSNQNLNIGHFRDVNYPEVLTPLPITGLESSTFGTINGIPSTSPREILRQEYVVNNINSLPDETCIFIVSRCGSINPSGNWNGFAMGTKKVNGIWTFPAVDIYGDPLPNIIGTQTLSGRVVTFNYTTDQQLSTNEIDNSKTEISVFPNPTNNFITIHSKQNLTDNFEFKIVDLTGRIVKNGNSKFNEQINIENLTSGNYIIQIQTDINDNFTKKLIKN